MLFRSVDVAPAGNIYDALMTDHLSDPAAFIVETGVTGLSAIPSDRHLAGAEV